MAVFLVHSPLLGPFSWSRAADHLQREGVRVVVPSLGEPSVRAGQIWQSQVRAVGDAISADASGEAVWIVGHSGAGPLLPAIGSDLGEPAAGYVFVDASLPHPGLSRFEALPGEFSEQLRSLARGPILPPWHRWFDPDAIGGLITDPDLRVRFEADIPRLPLSFFQEQLPEVDPWPDAPCGYLQLSDAYSDETAEARALGWPVDRLDGHHLYMLTHPFEVSNSLRTLVEELGGT